MLVGKDKGKQGIVSQVIQERNWVIVEGLNTHLRTVGGDKDFPGVLIQSESPLLVTNQVKLVDPVDLIGSDVEWRYTEEGEMVRVSLASGRVIPIPKMNEETRDYKSTSTYMAKEKDTEGSEVTKITYAAKLRTFEMDVMDDLKIEEPGEWKKSYWY